MIYASLLRSSLTVIIIACNRLDRITSGLMLICKNTQSADMLALQMRTGAIEKEYICRVSGEFPR
jgi:tRNA pseudouridine32 synthase